MTKLLLLFSLMMYGCIQCEDVDFEFKFNKTIQKLKMLQLNGINTDNTIDSVKIASGVITTLTNIRPRLSYNYTVTYSDENFKGDSIAWASWYKQNKCRMKQQIFDSVYNQLVLNFNRNMR